MDFPIIQNSFLASIREAGFASTLSVRLVRTIEIAMMAKTAGFDGLLIDMEHASFDVDLTTQLCLAALYVGICPIVRVPSNTTAFISRVLDGGALGVTIPHIRSVAEAQKAVDAAKFYPLGTRSATSGMPQFQYRAVKNGNAASNASTVVIPMIETLEALELVDEIAALEGVDSLLIDLRGVSSHGLARLAAYVQRAQDKFVNIDPDIKIRNVTPVMAQIDGDNGFGFVVASVAMEEAIRRAKTMGISIVTAKRSNHFGMAASYIQQAIDAGMMAMVFTNASRTMAPFGSKDALLGTSPIAVGLPSEIEIPYILDMAPSVVAKGKIRGAALKGQPIPEGWAVDEEGRPTTDPVAALKGLVLPIGGPKGSGIAMLVDIMAGVLSGSAFAGGVSSFYTDSRPSDVGHCFIVINPDALLEPGEVRKRMDTFVQKIHGSTPDKKFRKYGGSFIHS